MSHTALSDLPRVLQNKLEAANGKIIPTPAPTELDALELDVSIMLSIENHKDVQHLNDELCRCEDIAIELENLAMVADKVKVATNVDLAFIDVGTSLALAGTGVTSEELLPSMEDNLGDVISTEGLKRIASDVWKSIKNAISRIWKKVKEFWRNFTDQLPGILKAAQKLKTRAEETAGKSAEDSKFELGRLANTLALNHKAPKTASDISVGLNDLLSLSTAFYGDYSKSLVKVGKDLSSDISDFNLESFDDAERSLQAITNTVTGAKLSSVNKLLKDKVSGDSRFNKNTDVVSLELLSNKTLFLSTHTEASSILEKAEVSRRLRLELMNSSSKSKDGLEKGTMAIISPEDVIGIADIIISTIEEVSAFQRGSSFNSLDDARGKILSASDKLNKEHSSLKKSDDYDRSIGPIFTSGVNFNAAFARMSTKTQTSLAVLVASTSRAAIAVCNKSLSLHK